jgi:hypothetical protein
VIVVTIGELPSEDGYVQVPSRRPCPARGRWRDLLSSTPLLAQRSDRGTISGVVSDTQGSAVPGATVTVRNEDTGVETVLTTNSAGAYATNPLVLGRLLGQGQRQRLQDVGDLGIRSRAATPLRHDVKLDVGDIAETVEVTAADSYSTRPDVSHKVDEKYYHDLPVVTAADVRLAESVLLMQPGYLPMTPNGDPMFRGSQFGSRINGGRTGPPRTSSTAARSATPRAPAEPGERSPGRAIEEVTVVTTTYSASTVTRAAASSSTRRSRARTRSTEAPTATWPRTRLNTQGFFKLPKTPLDNKNYGVALGGPIIKNKTFFFVNIDWTKFRSGTLEGFGNTTPVDAFKAATSARSSVRRSASTCSGGPFCRARSSIPPRRASSTGSRARPLSRQHHPAERSPAQPGRRAYAALMVHPDRPGLSNNVAGQPGRRSDVGAGRARLLARIDHTFSPKLKAMFSGYYNNRPSVRNCGGARAARRERPADGLRIEHGLHRRGVHAAHLHDPRPHPVGLDHQQQPDEPPPP